MSEHDDSASRTPESDSRESLPSTPPSPDDATGSRLSRKREREVSLEPATPQATAIDIDNPQEYKERRTPAKKNRISAQLDSTREEEEGQSLSGSPPHETKIRQISQGVEDLTWKNMQKDKEAEEDKDDEMDVHDAGHDQEVDQIQAKVAGGEEIAVPPPLLQGENPPLVIDNAGEDEHGGEADPAEVPRDAQPSDPEDIAGSEVHPETPSTSPVPPSPPHSRRGSESDQEQGLKRKLGDRTVSERLVPEGRPSAVNGNGATIGATKRPRDDSEADANPRVTKRPTPPPDEEEGATTRKTAPGSPKKSAASTAQTPRLGGFMAYASLSSPFASVVGQSIFGSKNNSPSSSAWASTSTSPNPSPNLTASPFSSASSSSPAKSLESLSQPLALKRTGFEAFASSTSPFASAAKRPKSPPPLFGALGRSRSPSRSAGVRATSAFSAYAAGGVQSFSAHSTPRRGSPVLGESASASTSTSTSTNTSVEGASKDSVGLGILGADGKQDANMELEDANGANASSFSERLRAQKDQEEASDKQQRLELSEQEVLTGEEEETPICQVPGKLLVLMQNQWQERGSGVLRLNVNKVDGTRARLVMRKGAVFNVLLNATLFKGMRCTLAEDNRYLKFSMFESGSTIATHFSFKVQKPELAEELLQKINSFIPTD